jgi:hypothetical protein
VGPLRGAELETEDFELGTQNQNKPLWRIRWQATGGHFSSKFMRFRLEFDCFLPGVVQQ